MLTIYRGVEGFADGTAEGAFEGAAVVGTAVDGAVVDGAKLSKTVGNMEGATDGNWDGCILGDNVGAMLGWDGCIDGNNVGPYSKRD